MTFPDCVYAKIAFQVPSKKRNKRIFKRNVFVDYGIKADRIKPV